MKTFGKRVAVARQRRENEKKRYEKKDQRYGWCGIRTEKELFKDVDGTTGAVRVVVRIVQDGMQRGEKKGGEQRRR